MCAGWTHAHLAALPCVNAACDSWRKCHAGADSTLRLHAELLVLRDALLVWPLMRRGFLAPGVSSAAHGRIAEEAPFLECLPDGCVYEPSASGVNENLLLLLHGHGCAFALQVRALRQS